MNATNTKQSERFSREIAAGYKPEVITNTDVKVIGAGAIGQYLALSLAMIGFPRVTIVDMGVFDDESNITRSPFWVEGWNKAQAVACGALKFCTHTGDVDYRFSNCMIQQLGDAIFQTDDESNNVIFCAVDSQTARAWIAQRCRYLGIFLAEAGFRGQMYNCSIFLNSSETEPCWRCDQNTLEKSRIFSCDTYARTAIEAGFIPAIATAVACVANQMVEAGIALLHGDDQLANKTIFNNLRSGESSVLERSVNKECQNDHRVIVSDAIQLRCTTSDTVETLLVEISTLIAEPIVQLPAPFIRVVPCVDCYQSCLVERPDWAINQKITCLTCGGEFVRTTNIPEQYGQLSMRTCEPIFNLKLSQIGLGPGLHLLVNSRESEIVVALSGSIETLIEKV